MNRRGKRCSNGKHYTRKSADAHDWKVLAAKPQISAQGPEYAVGSGNLSMLYHLSNAFFSFSRSNVCFMKFFFYFTFLYATITTTKLDMNCHSIVTIGLLIGAEKMCATSSIIMMVECPMNILNLLYWMSDQRWTRWEVFTTGHVSAYGDGNKKF